MSARSRLRPRGWLVAVALCAAAGGCQTPGPNDTADSFGLDFSMPPGAAVSGAIVFFVDGVNAAIFQRMLEANELPAAKSYFADRGMYCPRAVASIPTVTLANETSFVTGRFPGHHGIVHNLWFDRSKWLFRNYKTIAQKNTLDGDYSAPNLYEQFPNAPTYSVFFQPHRGATFIENCAPGGIVFFFGWYMYLDRMNLNELRNVAAMARQQRAWPAVTVVYQLAPDFEGYRSGVSSPQYRQSLLHTDRQIGRVLGDLKRAGLLEKLTLVLLSDHGLTDVRNHFELEEFLRNHAGLDVGTRLSDERTPLARRQRALRRHTAVLVVAGDRFAALYLRRTVRKDGRPVGLAPWPDRPTAEDFRSYPFGKDGQIDLLDLLAGQEAVDAVAYRAGPGRVRVRRAGGEVEFRQEAGPRELVNYRLLAGDDPLGYRGSVPADALAGRPLSPRQWLEATDDTDFPDLPAQVLAYFRHERAGDLALFAAPGWDFNNRNRAGHGGIRAVDMHVPILIAGPGVPHGRIDAARSVDVMPTLLRLLGRPLPPGLDGQPLLGTGRRSLSPPRPAQRGR